GLEQPRGVVHPPRARGTSAPVRYSSRCLRSHRRYKRPSAAWARAVTAKPERNEKGRASHTAGEARLTSWWNRLWNSCTPVTPRPTATGWRHLRGPRPPLISTPPHAPATATYTPP